MAEGRPRLPGGTLSRVSQPPITWKVSHDGRPDDRTTGPRRRKSMPVCLATSPGCRRRHRVEPIRLRSGCRDGPQDTRCGAGVLAGEAACLWPWDEYACGVYPRIAGDFNQPAALEPGDDAASCGRFDLLGGGQFAKRFRAGKDEDLEKRGELRGADAGGFVLLAHGDAAGGWRRNEAVGGPRWFRLARDIFCLTSSSSNIVSYALTNIIWRSRHEYNCRWNRNYAPWPNRHQCKRRGAMSAAFYQDVLGLKLLFKAPPGWRFSTAAGCGWMPGPGGEARVRPSQLSSIFFGSRYSRGLRQAERERSAF